MKLGRFAESVTDFRLTAGEASKRIRTIAKTSENVVFGTHAYERMDERGITDAQVFEVLQKGQVFDPPSLTKFGEWECKIIEPLRGGRSVGVALVFLKTGKLFLKTVEWEDIK